MTVGDVVTEVTNLDVGDGCTINDLIDESSGHASHGAFVTHVAEVTTGLRKEGHISGAERGAIVSAAARSDVAQQ
ncbi:hypothetical protein [Georgenia sp. SUBG003]|uniref:hypothetical protein n=1 Tax=Georgenia sp. SUBG003 TaxID=1497974 RepID=UPI003AB7397B